MARVRAELGGTLEFMRRTVPWFLFCVLLIAWWVFLPPPAAWLDRVYGSGVYPAIAGVLVPLTGSGALPVTPILLAVLLVWLVLSVALNKRRRETSVWRWLWRGVVTAATLYALFIVLWGANYGKTPVETRLGPLPHAADPGRGARAGEQHEHLAPSGRRRT